MRLQLNALEESKYDDSKDRSVEKKKEIRLWVEGAFDMMHYGHMNAFRQTKALGTYLLAGVNSDETITVCKGPPITSEDERISMVKACRWVDEVVTGVPYVMSPEYIKHIMDKYKIDYIVHGDDPCIVDGKDVYELPKRMGKYLEIPRTQGISTTDIVGRILLMTKSHHSRSFDETNNDNTIPTVTIDSTNEEKLLSRRRQRDFSRKSNFLTTSVIMQQFSSGTTAPTKDDVIVYIPGSWDLFHAGHVELLEKSHDYGTYIIVGVYSDMVVNSKRGHNFPILNLHERILSVLGCKYVNDVLFDAPYEITESFLSSLNVSVVVKGSEPIDDTLYDSKLENQTGVQIDPFYSPKSKGILKIIPVTKNITVYDILNRINSERDRYVQKYKRKKQQEDEYYLSKQINSIIE